MFGFPSYIPRIERGLVNLNPEIKPIAENSSYALLDGDNGLGQVVAVKAANMAVKKAEKSGIGIVLTRNTNYIGMLAYYTLKIVVQNMIGIMFVNAPPFVAPWGCKQPKLGTNPVSIAAPTGKEYPFVLDMGITAGAVGKVRLAILKGEKIPEEWALDRCGKPTTDPNEALKGALLPMGGPKGYALGLAVEILSGVLTGGSFTSNMPHPIFNLNEPPNLGNLILATNIEAFMDLNGYLTRMDELIKDIKSCERAEGFSEVLIPSELEYRTEQKHTKEGIQVPEETWRQLEEIMNRYSIKF